jgi:hypothetical protein
VNKVGKASEVVRWTRRRGKWAGASRIRVRWRTRSSQTQKSIPFKPGSHVVAVNKRQVFFREACKDQKDVPEDTLSTAVWVSRRTTALPGDLRLTQRLTLNKNILISDMVPKPVESWGHLGLKKLIFKKLSV